MLDDTTIYQLMQTINDLKKEIVKLQTEVNDLRIAIRDDINSR